MVHDELCIQLSYRCFPFVSATFLKFTLVLSGGSTLMQVLVLNVYYKGHSKMPKTVKYYILQPLSVLTLVPIPGMKNHTCKSKPVSFYP